MLCVPCWVVFLGRVLVYTGEVCRQDSEYTRVITRVHTGWGGSCTQRFFRVSPGKRVFSGCTHWGMCVHVAPFVLWRWAGQGFS